MKVSKSTVGEWLLLVMLTLGLMLLQGGYRFWMFAETFAIKKGSINADMMIAAFWESPKLQSDLLHYLMMQFLLHLSLAVLAWLLARCFLKRLPDYANQPKRVIVLFWAVLVLCTFIGNSLVYKFSFFSWYTAINEWFAIAFLALVGALTIYLSRGWVLLLVAAWLLPFTSTTKHTVAESEQPNIFIIGVDSLRADIIEAEQSPAPVLKAITESSAYFKNTLTPVARTFPAWISILTGNAPQTTGVRINLQNVSEMDWSQTLPSILQTRGYQTAYITDEKRFSNIDHRYGFDVLGGPEIGAYDFMLGRINDFPLSNLVMNSGLGKKLFRYTHLNRAADHVYDPDYFVDKTIELLGGMGSKGSVFAAVHLCLPHWPYVWGDAGRDKTLFVRYLKAAAEADRQVGRLLDGLQRKGMLENSIVVFLSDHGEAFPTAYENGKPLFPWLSEKYVDYVGLHGTDLLSINQNRVLLAIKDYRPKARFNPQTVTEVASLMDIAPTLLGLVGMERPSDRYFDGVDLLAEGSEAILQSRTLFLETGFTVEAMFRAKGLNLTDIVNESFDFYEIDTDTGRLQVKHDSAHSLIENKSFGVLKDGLLKVTGASHEAGNTLDIKTGEVFFSEPLE
ncbi:sulfatase-like hydrolase/transferase [Endozoicomonas lisbonensis]|uniref:Sulfatase N-terminal domain-containing protein n=1 Tax=Endozoicomonas lisbonensis TaxID=3120522 RepID=A0ABV2SJX0_9GAMM